MDLYNFIYFWLNIDFVLSLYSQGLQTCLVALLSWYANYASFFSYVRFNIEMSREKHLFKKRKAISIHIHNLLYDHDTFNAYITCSAIYVWNP